VMINSHDGGIYLVDSFGQTQKIADSFESWISRSLRQALLKDRYGGNLVVIGFDDESRASEAKADLEALQRNNLIELEDVVVLVRKKNGKVKFKHMNSLSAAGAMRGTFAGMLLGVLFLHPLVGAALGLTAGAASNSLSDSAIDDRFVKELASTLKPGTSALFVLTRRVDSERITPELRGFGGRVLMASISGERQAELQAVLDSGKEELSE